MIKTRQITEGSMLVAITGALILMDRLFSMFFEDVILLLVPASIILYARKYSFKDSIGLSIAFLFLCFFGNITT